MDRELVVTADDFGWSRSVNRGILESHLTGIVTRTSIMAAGAAFEDAAELALSTPTLGIGVHLNLYRGRTMLAREHVNTLVDGPESTFFGDWRTIVRRLTTRRIDLSQVEEEFRAQIQHVCSAGLNPLHMDSDKHLHLWPSLFDVVCRLALEFGIPQVRVVREPLRMDLIPAGLSVLSRRDARVAEGLGLIVPTGTIGVSMAPINFRALEGLLRAARGQCVEFVVHPGYVDAEFMELQSALPNRLVEIREAELEVLATQEARDAVAHAGFTLAGTLSKPQA